VFAPNKSQVAAEFLSLCFKSVRWREKKDKKKERDKKERREVQKFAISFSLVEKIQRS
jgi:hypothetical protein